MHTTALAVGLLSAACLLSPGATPEASTAGRLAPGEHFPRPAEPLIVSGPGDRNTSLLDLVGDLARIGGVNVSLSADVRATLEATPVGLVSEAVVPPEAVWAFAESLLQHHGYVVSELRGSEPRLISVHSVNEHASGFRWVPIEASQVDAYGDHAALLVETWVSFENLDTRQLITSMRGIMLDGTQAALALGSSNSVFLRGTGSRVAALVALMRGADREAGTWIERRREQQARDAAAADEDDEVDEAEGGR